MKTLAWILILGCLGCGQGSEQGAPASATLPPDLTPPVRKALPVAPRPVARKPTPRPQPTAAPVAGQAETAAEPDLDPELDADDLLEVVEFSKQVQAPPVTLTGISDLEAVIGMSESGVLAIMGQPDQKYLRKDGTSYYYSRIEANGAGQKGCPELILRDNKVVEAKVHSLAEMIDLMVNARLNKGVEPEVRARMATFTFDEALKRISNGSSKKEVRKLWGEPDLKLLLNDRETWRYETLIVENGTKKTLDVAFEDDVVVELDRK